MARILFFLALSVGTTFFASASLAMPVVYRLDVEITSATVENVPEDSPYYPCHVVDCDPLGHHIGFFALDSAVLQHEGLIATRPLSFYLEVSGYVWDSENPSHFAGYRYLCTTTPDECDFGGLTVEVEAGRLKGICCGVFGGGDIPFVDLFGSWPFVEPVNRVSILTDGDVDTAPDGHLIVLPSIWAGGTYTFSLIPEPTTLALLGISLAGLGFSRRKHAA